MPVAGPELEDLFQAHRRGLLGSVRSVLGQRADAAELLQEAFLRCWPGWQRGERPSDPVGWIFVVTWNVAVDARRRLARRPEPAPIDEDHPMQAMTDAPSTALERQEELQRAQAAVERLGDHEKQVFLLRVSAGLSFSAVAAALGIPEGTAKTRMRSALERLRRGLGVLPFAGPGAERA